MKDRNKKAVRGIVRTGAFAVALLAGGGGVLFAQNANSGTSGSQGAIQSGSIQVQPQSYNLVSKAKISMTQAINAATNARPGATVVGAEISVANGSLVYEVQLADRSSSPGITTEVVDAGNGNILGTLSGNAGELGNQRGQHQGEFGRQGDTENGGENGGENAD